MKFYRIFSNRFAGFIHVTITAMIRIAFLTLLFSLFGIALIAQANVPARQWFYNASISNESRVNQEILSSNKSLQPVNVMSKVRTEPSDTCFIYAGKIAQSSLFDTYKLDSAVLLSTCANAAGATDQVYKGNLKLLSVEYYVQDGKELDALYKEAISSLLVQAKRQDNRAIIDTPDDTGAMHERIFVDNANAHHKVSIWKFEGKRSGTYRLKIEETASAR